MQKQEMERPLGSRGSRRVVSSAEADAELSPTASAVLAAIPAWWSARASEEGLSGRWLDVTQAVDASPPFSMTDMSQLEEEWGPLSGEAVGEAYVNALSEATRARHGRHYTPARLASSLWGQAKRAMGGEAGVPYRLSGLLRDPACGAGALLLPALRDHLRAVSDSDPRFILAQVPDLIEGIDNDPAAVWIANLVLAAEMLPVLAKIPQRDRRPLPALCRVGDGLTAQNRKAQIVLMNPPYGRVKLTEVERQRFADVIYGHVNLYGIFMASGEEQLTEDGVLSALVPTSFLAGRYFSPLRGRLSSSVTLSEVGFVAKRSGVFESVLQETCLATFTRVTTDTSRVWLVNQQEDMEITTVPVPRGQKPWILPRRVELASVGAAAGEMTLTLADTGWRVSTGPLVWNRRADDLHPTPGINRVPVLWAGDFESGVLTPDYRRDSKRYLEIRSERDAAVMMLTEPAVLVQRTSAPEQLRRITAYVLTQGDLDRLGGGVVVENHVNVIRATKNDTTLPLDLLGQLLTSSALDAVARCISGSVALSAFELSALPFPGKDILEHWQTLSGGQLTLEINRAYGIRKVVDNAATD